MADSLRKDLKCRIIAGEELGHGYHRFRLTPNERFEALPGQFVMVRVFEGSAPLLRRPFSIHRFDETTGEFELLFRVVGQGTALMSALSTESTLDVLAPLGTGFGAGNAQPILVGGGIGVAPLLFLADHFAKTGKTTSLFAGGRTKADLLRIEEFEKLGLPVKISTDDGSMGEKALVTELLAVELEKRGEAGREKASVHACGPIPMLAAVARLCEGYGVKCEVSLESHMACGVGACLGCIVKGAGGENVRVCKEGPVFDRTRLMWP